METRTDGEPETEIGVDVDVGSGGKEEYGNMSAIKHPFGPV